MNKRDIVRRMGEIIVQVEQLQAELDGLEKRLVGEISKTLGKRPSSARKDSASPTAKAGTMQHAILRALTKKGQMRGKDLAKAVGKSCIEEISSCLTGMVERRQIVRVSRGVYEVAK